MVISNDNIRRLKIALIVLLFILLGSLGSCDVLKKTTKVREDRTVKESTETITQRKGDTITYFIPKIKYKDTTIVKTNRITGTTQVLRYNNEGQIDLAQCISGAIEEITKSNKELVEAINNKEKVKETEFKTVTLLYIILGFMGVVLILVFFLFKYISKNTALVSRLIK